MNLRRAAQRIVRIDHFRREKRILFQAAKNATIGAETPDRIIPERSRNIGG
jgi:hypothetical protein